MRMLKAIGALVILLFAVSTAQAGYVSMKDLAAYYAAGDSVQIYKQLTSRILKNWHDTDALLKRAYYFKINNLPSPAAGDLRKAAKLMTPRSKNWQFTFFRLLKEYELYSELLQLLGNIHNKYLIKKVMEDLFPALVQKKMNPGEFQQLARKSARPMPALRSDTRVLEFYKAIGWTEALEALKSDTPVSVHPADTAAK